MISVVIPTFNAGAEFQKLLDALDCQTIKPKTIYIVDSGSDDGTVATAENHGCEVLTINRQDFDHGTARNLPTSKTKTEFVVFLTQDAIPADECMLAELIKPMQVDSNIAMCYGRQLPKPEATPLERFAREFNYPTQSILKTAANINTLGLKTFFCSNVCSAVRKSLFEKLGGFQENVMTNEDMLFAAKAIHNSYSIYYSATAKVYHSHSYSSFETFKRYFRIGRFFAANKRFFERTGLKNYGGDFLKASIKTFWQQDKSYYIIALFAELAIKTIACKAGWYYQTLIGEKPVISGKSLEH